MQTLTTRNDECFSLHAFSMVIQKKTNSCHCLPDRSRFCEFLQKAFLTCFTNMLRSSTLCRKIQAREGPRKCVHSVNDLALVHRSICILKEYKTSLYHTFTVDKFSWKHSEQEQDNKNHIFTLCFVVFQGCIRSWPGHVRVEKPTIVTCAFLQHESMETRRKKNCRPWDAAVNGSHPNGFNWNGSARTYCIVALISHEHHREDVS